MRRAAAAGFFAYPFPGGTRLATRTVVVDLGMAAVLIPLGAGSAAVSHLLCGHHALLAGYLRDAADRIRAGRAVWSRVQIARLARLRARVRGDSIPAVFALGAVSGLAGFCSGPVLGAVLTVAAASGQLGYGAALLAVYAAGMAAPLFALAALWGHRKLAGFVDRVVCVPSQRMPGPSVTPRSRKWDVPGQVRTPAGALHLSGLGVAARFGGPGLAL